MFKATFFLSVNSPFSPAPEKEIVPHTAAPPGPKSPFLCTRISSSDSSKSSASQCKPGNSALKCSSTSPTTARLPSLSTQKLASNLLRDFGRRRTSAGVGRLRHSRPQVHQHQFSQSLRGLGRIRAGAHLPNV